MKNVFWVFLTVATLSVGCVSKPHFTCTSSRNVTLLKGAVLIDVRTQKEYDKRHLNRAVLIPHDKIKEHIAGFVLGRDAIIYVYCGSGYRADKACKALNELGYRNVVNLCGINVAEAALKK